MTVTRIAKHRAMDMKSGTRFSSVRTHDEKAVSICVTESVLPRSFLEYLLFFFIIGMMTLSNIKGWSKLMILYGLFVSSLFVVYFLVARLRMQPEIAVYLGWVLWSLTGMFKATDMTLYIRNLMTIAQIGVLVFVVAGITALRRNISVVILGVTIGGIIVALSSYYTGEIWIAADTDANLQAVGLVGNANNFAYHLLFVLFGVFYFFGRKPSWRWRVFLVTVIVVAMFCIIQSGSKKVLLGVLAFVLLWHYFCQSKRLTKNPVKVLASLTILLGIAYFTTDYVMSNTYMGKRFQLLSEYRRGTRIDLSTQHRIQFYQDGLDIIKRNPFVGIGLDQFRTLSWLHAYSHSDYIEVATNTGLVGFVLYFGIYVIMWLRLNRLEKMLDDSHLLYTIGLLKAAIITMLLIGFGSANIRCKLAWIFVAGAIGYTWSIERVLRRSLHHLVSGDD